MMMFKARLLSSVVLVIAALAAILPGGYFLAAVLFAISFIGCSELYRACGIHEEGKKINALEAAGYVSIVLYYGAIVFGEEAELQLIAVIFALVAFMFVYVFRFPEYHAEKVMSAFFCLVYAPVMISFIYMTRELEYGIYVVWLIFISSWICDTCAYLTGSAIGRHKLTPRLSPKKSIEGAAGGILGAMIVGGLYGLLVAEKSGQSPEMAGAFVVISGVGAVVAQIGDLAASAIKRNHQIKDYGKLIPGHGGIMDRFDSVIFTAPMIYALAVMLMD